ncbi:MAG: pyridoxamine 5'-phosphate oxidase family protein [Ktedonobacteraceae bacterium]|nr:pyridoxamine 5'-phosphate oxidase family protein [Ktedonobacteraceae bacterium]
MKIATFAEIADEFLARVNKAVWCNVATIDGKNRPRSRILHPIWQGEVGWITTRRRTPKEQHLEAHPFVSLAYIADVVKPVYADCKAVWIEGLAVKQQIWQLLQNTPPPLGFDPAPIYGTVDNPDFGLLKLTPWRIEVTSVATVPAERKIWYASEIAKEVAIQEIS